ncbi:MAG: hypothetical protein HQL79_07830 [Magnetococcales bacterium]|nr:hypothetical protein [Magnetococcales bacterium]
MKHGRRTHRPTGWLAGIGVLVLFFQLLSPAWGLTLGSMDVKSYQGEPFNATISITLAGKESLLNLVASKATPQDYAPLHLEYHEQVSSLQLDLDGQGGQRKLSIRSKTPITTPFFNFLLKLSTGQGDHFRNYPVFLDVRPSTLSADFQPPLPIVAPQESTFVAANKGEYGPVRPGDSLLKIAEKYATPPITRQQMAVAIYESNKTQFIDGNISNLPVGVILKVPDKTRVAALNAEHAKNQETSKATGGDKSSTDKPATAPESSTETQKAATSKSTEPKAAGATIVRSKPTVTTTGPAEGSATPASSPPSKDAKASQDAKADASKPSANEVVPAPPPPPVIDKAEVDSLKQSVSSLNDQLKASEEARTRLQGQVGLLENRLKKLEQQPKAPPPAPIPPPTPIDIPWDMAGFAGGALVLIIGLMGYLRWRRNQSEPKHWTLRFSHAEQPPLQVTDPPSEPPPAPTTLPVPVAASAVLTALQPQMGMPSVPDTSMQVDMPSVQANLPSVPDTPMVDAPQPTTSIETAALTTLNKQEPEQAEQEPEQTESPLPETEDIVVIEEETSPALVRSVADIISGTRTVLPTSSRNQEPPSIEDESLDPNIMVLGGDDRDDGDSIFNLNDQKSDPLKVSDPNQTNFTRDSDSLIDLGNEDDSPASIFNFDNKSTTPLQSTPDPVESMAAPVASLVEMGVEEGSATDSIAPEAAQPKASTVDDGTLEVETLVFEVPVIPEVTPASIQPTPVDTDVETIQFDLVTKPAVENPEKSPGKKKVKSTSKPAPTKAPMDDEMPVIELLDEQRSSGND